MKAVILTSVMLLLVGCTTTKPERTEAPSNKDYKVDQLFTDKNGYTIYRFWDAGDYRYYVVSPTGQGQMIPSTRTVDNSGVSVGVGVGFH